jgi:hypothetical protein
MRHVIRSQRGNGAAERTSNIERGLAGGRGAKPRVHLRHTFARLAFACIFSIGSLAAVSAGRNITWSGYSWNVRDTGGNPQGPGPNIFSNSTDNVFVDAGGDLHLKIRKGANGKWLASEIDLNQSLTFGTYEWEVSSRYDQLAANAVGGLFTYISPESVAAQTGGVVGNGIPDTPHEIDVEFTGAWGNGNLYFTTHDGDVPAPSKNFYQALTGDFTTHRFKWEPDRITWESFNGHVAGVASPPNPLVEQRPGATNGNPAKFVYSGPVIPKDLNEVPILNFWISSNDPANGGPTGGAEQELIVHSFKFSPLPPPVPVTGDYDGNGVVNSADYLVWQQAFGSTSSLAADGNHNGVVDASDYTIWRDHLGPAAGEASALATSVPEPTTILIAPWLVTLSLNCRWRYCHSH